MNSNADRMRIECERTFSKVHKHLPYQSVTDSLVIDLTDF